MSESEPLSYPIVDGHAHIFPYLGGSSGFPDAETHLMYIQRAMHTHLAQPVRRARDHVIATEKTLWDPHDPSPQGMRDVSFRAGRNGRFEWVWNAEEYYIQFMPPSLQAMEAPADYLIAEMDYAGIESAVLQNDPIYGRLEEFFADAIRRYPGRFFGVARVEESLAYHEHEIKRLHQCVEQLGMRGLYYNVSTFFRTGYRMYYSDDAFKAFWNEVERLRMPVFWVIPASSPIGNYTDEMSHLRQVLECFPSIQSVLVHGLPDGLLLDNAIRLRLPAWLTDLVSNFTIYAELLFAIKWGRVWDYPYPHSNAIFWQYYDTFGPERLIWGSDMPNVLRYCTCSQALTHVRDKCGDCLSLNDKRALFGGNALALLHQSLSCTPTSATP